MSRAIPSPEIWHRSDFSYLCFHRNLRKVAEIGVNKGLFAEEFLRRWIGEEYWAIDDYRPYPEMDFDRQADFMMAVSRISPHAGVAHIVRLPSLEASRLFAPGSLDFVYIDAAHDYGSVTDDILNWYPKLSRKGMLAGHDYDESHPGVIAAVDDFARARGHVVYTTAVPGYLREDQPSWYLYRDGIPGPDWRRC